MYWDVEPIVILGLIEKRNEYMEDEERRGGGRRKGK